MSRGGKRSKYLFVYGSLRRGQRLHGQLRNSPATAFVGRATIRAALYAISGETYSGAVAARGRNANVHGELYRLGNTRATLKKLDRMEGTEEGLIRRALVEANTRAGRKMAWVYLYARPLGGSVLIPSGVFRKD